MPAPSLTAPSSPDSPNWPPSALLSHPDSIRRPLPPTPEEISASTLRLRAGLADATARREAVVALPTPLPEPTLSAPLVAATGAIPRAALVAAPPARIALTAGDWNAKPDYEMGRSMTTGAPIAVVPVMARAGDSAMPMMEGGLRIRSAREMDAGTANTTLNSIAAHLMHWAADFPHAAIGDGAVLLQTARQLIQNREARRNAAAYGQTDFVDPSANTAHAPPPESLLLGQLQTQAKAVLTIYEKVLGLAGISLVQPDQAAVDMLKGMIHVPVR